MIKHSKASDIASGAKCNLHEGKILEAIMQVLTMVRRPEILLDYGLLLFLKSNLFTPFPDFSGRESKMEAPYYKLEDSHEFTSLWP